MIIRYEVAGILLFFLVLLSLKESQAKNNSTQVKCICLDAGHGGFAGKGGDPGSIGTFSQEKNLTLAIVLKLGKLISDTYPDVKVVYTRTKDVGVDLRMRGKVANDNRADLFISVHINSSIHKTAHGLETYVLGSCRTKENLEMAIKENSVIKYEKDYEKHYEGFDPTSVSAYIMFNLMQGLHLEKSLELAACVQEEMVRGVQRADRGVSQNGYLVLKDATMPAILIEAGFISNLQEERLLNTEAGQNKVARSIFQGIAKYKTNLEKNIKTPAAGKQEKDSDMLAKNTKNVPEVPVKESKKVEVKEIEKPAQREVKVDETKTRPFYAIQVASASGKIKNASRLCEGEDVCELYSGGRYRYYVVQSENFDDVKKSLQKIKRKVHDCFIIAVHKGDIIPVAEARKKE